MIIRELPLKFNKQQMQQCFYSLSENIASEKEKRMNAKQANRISIRNYLSSIGINPVRSNKRSSLYLAPYREEKSPSLKVDHDQNLWVDFGNDNKGGTLIDLVLKLNPHYNVSDAIRAIEKSILSFFSFHQQKTLYQSKHESRKSKFESRESEIEKPESKKIISNSCHLTADIQHLIDVSGTDNIGTDISGIAKIGTAKQEYLTSIRGTINSYYLKDLNHNPAITAYVKQRGIQVATAMPFCKEIYYSINGRKYFGLGNQNDQGWSIRNKYWKGCTAQGYSFFNRGFNTIAVFEGIFDLLSFNEMYTCNQTQTDFLVLNSLVNLKKTIDIIENYDCINLFLDYDEAGRKATAETLNIIPHAHDVSHIYSAYKDLNDYHLVKVKKQLPTDKTKPDTGNCGPSSYEASHVLARPKRLLR